MGGTVNDPTGWVITAARKDAELRHHPTLDPNWGVGDNWGVMHSGQQSGLGGPLEGKLRTRISWLNDKAGLAAPLISDKVVEALQSIGDIEAMRVLKILEQKHDSVRDPT